MEEARGESEASRRRFNHGDNARPRGRSVSLAGVPGGSTAARAGIRACLNRIRSYADGRMSSIADYRETANSNDGSFGTTRSIGAS
jgi:hypothetical protein